VRSAAGSHPRSLPCQDLPLVLWPVDRVPADKVPCGRILRLQIGRSAGLFQEVVFGGAGLRVPRVQALKKQRKIASVFDMTRVSAYVLRRKNGQKMPTYEYECTKCGHRFDAYQSIKAEPLTKCPTCKGRVKRLLSTGGGLLFKGSGFYITDYRSDSYKQAAKADVKPPTPVAPPAASATAKKPAPKSGKGKPA